MPGTGWFYRSFANSFTLCLIVFSVLQTLLAVSCLFSLVGQAGRPKTIDKKTVVDLQPLAASPSPPPTRKTIESSARSASKPDQANQIKQSVKLLANER